MTKWPKIAAAVLAAIAIVLLAYTLLTDQPDEEVVTPGMGDRHIYNSTDLIVIVLSSFLIAIAVMFILLREEYEPLPPSMEVVRAPPPPADEAEQRGEPTAPTAAGWSTPEARARESYLVLRLLTGDERTMYKAIMDVGGKALQKDLIKSTKMSNAKVSRVLDRLSEKGVIRKERHGSTNMVELTPSDE